MSDHIQGRTFRLTPARRVMCELLHHGRRVPALPLARMLNVSPLAEARANAAERPSWLSIFVRAYAIVAQYRSPLRQALIPWPYARIYEHPVTVCTIPVARQWADEQVVLFGKIYTPEGQDLASIDCEIQYFKTVSVWADGSFRQCLRLGRMPWPLRRLLFWRVLNFSGPRRAKRLGTCIASSVGSLQAEQRAVITPLTTYLSFGPVDSTGDVMVTLVYDHRVMDASFAAQCLNDLNEVLQRTILHELRAGSPYAVAQGRLRPEADLPFRLPDVHAPADRFPSQTRRPA